MLSPFRNITTVFGISWKVVSRGGIQMFQNSMFAAEMQRKSFLLSQRAECGDWKRKRSTTLH